MSISPFAFGIVAFVASLLVLANAEPESHKLGIDILSAHYTACLVNARGKDHWQLPSFARENPVVFMDDEGNDFYVAIYSTVTLTPINLDVDAPLVEFCHAFLSENTGRLADAVPEATRIQSSKCFGLDSPGYDGPDLVELKASKSDFGVMTTVLVNGTHIYSQTPIPYTPVNLTGMREEVYLETYHTHYADADAEKVEDSPYYGYFMRVFNSNAATFKVNPVMPHIGAGFNELYGTSVDPSDVHSCISIESFEVDGAAPLTGISILGHYDLEASPEDYLENVDKQDLREALLLDSQPQGNNNLEDTIFEIFDTYLHPFGAAGFEFDWMAKFRTVTGILDLMYVFLMALQRKLNGQYPSSRFNKHMHFMFLHIISGMICIWGGTAIHFYNEARTITVEEDQGMIWQSIYYAFGAAGVVQAFSVFTLMPQVMGEKRITVPIYFGAGVVNLSNAIVLLISPNLKNVFLLWGSVNTFIYVRAYIVLLSFSHIDWELLYTYAILAAAATTYPLTIQDMRVYYLLAAPIVYAPFHERICRWFPWLGFTEEDWTDGNKPSAKNIPKVTVMLRTLTVDKEYAKKVQELENDTGITTALKRIQSSFRDKRISVDPPSVHMTVQDKEGKDVSVELGIGLDAESEEEGTNHTRHTMESTSNEEMDVSFFPVDLEYEAPPNLGRTRSQMSRRRSSLSTMTAADHISLAFSRIQENVRMMSEGVPQKCAPQNSVDV